MFNALADFRIENDSVVLLSFADGSQYRVNPKDLSEYLSKADLAKVQQALKVRRQFMKRILPPTALFVLGACVVALGSYDAHRISQMMHPVTPTATAQTETSTKHPAQTPAASVEEPKPAAATAGPQASSNLQPATSVATSPTATAASQRGDGTVQSVTKSLDDERSSLLHELDKQVNQALNLLNLH